MFSLLFYLVLFYQTLWYYIIASISTIRCHLFQQSRFISTYKNCTSPFVQIQIVNPHCSFRFIVLMFWGSTDETYQRHVQGQEKQKTRSPIGPRFSKQSTGTVVFSYYFVSKTLVTVFFFQALPYRISFFLFLKSAGKHHTFSIFDSFNDIYDFFMKLYAEIQFTIGFS